MAKFNRPDRKITKLVVLLSKDGEDMYISQPEELTREEILEIIKALFEMNEV